MLRIRFYLTRPQLNWALASNILFVTSWDVFQFRLPSLSASFVGMDGCAPIVVGQRCFRRR